MLKLFQIWSIGTLSVGFSVLLTKVLFLVCLFIYVFIYFNCFCAFWYYKMFQVHVAHFLPQSYNQPFLEGTLVPFLGVIVLETKIWVLDVHISDGISLLPGLLGCQSKEAYVYSSLWTCTFLQIFLYETIYACIKQNMNLYWCVHL